jgi:hypothetical protein
VRRWERRRGPLVWRCVVLVVLDVALHELGQAHEAAQARTVSSESYDADESGSLVSSLAADAGRRSGASADSRNCGEFTSSLALDTNIRVEPAGLRFDQE